MKLNMGIKIDDDLEYKKIQDTKISLKADRQKSNTDKGLDDLLFGSGAGVRRRPKPADGAAQPSAPKPEVQKPVPAPVQEKKQLPKQETVVKPVEIKKQPAKIQKPIQRPAQKPTSKPIQKPPVKIQKPAQVIQKIDENPRAQNSSRQGYNRPSYIRKLRKIAENFNYVQINSRNHCFFDVVRPFQCQKNIVQMKQSLGTGQFGFIDKQFPTTFSSLGRKYKRENIAWERAYLYCNRPAFGKYVQPNDIQIGSLSSPSFVSILSCLAQRQQNIKRLIQNQQYNENGFYFVRLNINSVWRYISVDDFLPSIDGDNVGLLSFKDSQSDISLSIIQKAYAKAYGGYDVFTKSCLPQHYLRDLTGSRVAKYSLNSSDFNESLQFALQQNWTIVAVPNKRIEQLGFNSSYNLSIVGLGSRGLEVRNSWGSTVERPKVNMTKQGIFELSFSQASKYFDYVLVAQTDDKYYTSSVQSKHQTGFYSTYSFKLKSSSQSIISVSQWDHRLLPSVSSYEYTPFRIILQKTTSSGGEYVAGAFSHKSRNLDFIVNLTPGQYTVFCIGSWAKGQSYDYTLTLFSNHAVKFQRSYSQFFPNLISNSLQKVNLNNGKRAAKGHVDEYILYHEPTNLVLLSNLNVSDKPYDYTQDLSKINFGTLNLLNGPNVQTDHFASKLQQQISSIKSDHNNERRWSIHLQPKQAYTWVMSTSQDFNMSNFKNWGFK